MDRFGLSNDVKKSLDGKYVYTFIDIGLTANDEKREKAFLNKIIELKLYFEDPPEVGGIEGGFPAIDKNDIVIQILWRDRPTEQMMACRHLQLSTGEKVPFVFKELDESELDEESRKMISKRLNKKWWQFWV